MMSGMLALNLGLLALFFYIVLSEKAEIETKCEKYPKFNNFQSGRLTREKVQDAS